MVGKFYWVVFILIPQGSPCLQQVSLALEVSYLSLGKISAVHFLITCMLLKIDGQLSQDNQMFLLLLSENESDVCPGACS